MVISNEMRIDAVMVCLGMALRVVRKYFLICINRSSCCKAFLNESQTKMRNKEGLRDNSSAIVRKMRFFVELTKNFCIAVIEGRALKVDFLR